MSSKGQASRVPCRRGERGGGRDGRRDREREGKVKEGREWKGNREGGEG